MPRCAWATTEPAITYHNKEWGVPVHDDQVLFEFLILEGAQAGLSWNTISKKRENYRKALHGFRPEKIARYNKRNVQRLLGNDGIVRIRIADTGKGLTPEECKRLFTPYYTTKQHGTGLGLAIVQSVVADHAGTIAVESCEGRGATFVITLPRA